MPQLDQDNRAYKYTGDGYVQIPVATAVDEVFDEIEEMGCSRETKYDEEFVARKHKALREAGWTGITTGTPASGEMLRQLESPEALNVSNEL